MMENLVAMLLIGGGFMIGYLVVIGLVLFVFTRKPVLRRIMAWTYNFSTMLETYMEEKMSEEES